MKYALSIFILFSCTSVLSAQQVEKEFINPFRIKPSGYTHTVVSSSGRTIYISGQVPVNEAGQVVGEGDLKAQTKQVYDNLLYCLRFAGARFEDVVKMTTYVVNYKPSDIDIVREVRKGYLSKENPPASTLVGVQSLVHPDYLIEIEAIAVIPDKQD
ncbi:MAG: RidA family protein [Cytophagia bacterium]|nr:RidA family protein [Cytophagia bacterium]NBW38995.1 RidA family protein [Cytophagia bacterium]